MKKIILESRKTKKHTPKKRTKRNKIKITYTTGDPALNIKHFNKMMGTDYNNPSTEEAKEAAKDANANMGIESNNTSGNADIGEIIGGTNDAGTDFGGEGGGEGMGESLDLHEAVELDETKLRNILKTLSNKALAEFNNMHWDEQTVVENNRFCIYDVPSNEVNENLSRDEFISLLVNTIWEAYGIDDEEQLIKAIVKDLNICRTIKESLTEAKRDVRRYYIRPQNIFCANKSEIIRTLIEIGDQNCSVYTLKNLGDIKDVRKLKTKDIIYYYDDGILYDKNHVRVMDYDLYIKHEEERKKFNKTPDQITPTEYKQEYDDRITHETGIEENLKEEVTEITKDQKEGILDSFENNDINIKGIHKENDKLVIEGDNASPEKLDSLNDELADLAEEKPDLNFDIEPNKNGKFGRDYEFYQGEDETIYTENLTEDQEFNLDFEAVNAFGESVDHPTHICCICGEEFEGYGNNPYPVKDEGVCCDSCNRKFVIPARIANMYKN